MSRPLRVFLCHAREDKSIVRELYRQLTAEGWMDVWLDQQKLLPGQNWDVEIEKAVEESDVVIVCLSKQSINKEGYVQSEQSFVLDIARTKPEETIFVIPLRLDECNVPRRLRTWHYLDYFPKSNQRWAYQRLLESLKLRAAKLGVSIEKPVPIPVEDERAKTERERIAAQKAEAERVAREKTERERKAKAERDRIARQKAEEQRIARIEALRKINFKPILAIGGIILVLLCLVFGVNYLIKNFPASPTSPKILNSPTPSETEVSFIPTKTQIPSTNTPEPPTFTPTPGIGSTITSEKDQMTMVFVPAGKFTMGNKAEDALAECQKYRSDCKLDWFKNEEPPHEVDVSAFWIDQTEVTNAMYAKCVADGVCKEPSSKSSNAHSSYYGNSEFDNYPAIYVDWNMAKTYCEWRDDRLPTEAEWEKAASWDYATNTKRIYPWGDSIDCSYANYYDSKANKFCVGDTTKAGSYESSKSPYGLYDMAGNVWEWVSSLYKPFPYSATDGREDLASSGSRVLRGGSWFFNDYFARSSYRYVNSPDYILSLFGFRCARSLP